MGLGVKGFRVYHMLLDIQDSMYGAFGLLGLGLACLWTDADEKGKAPRASALNPKPCICAQTLNRKP